MLPIKSNGEDQQTLHETLSAKSPALRSCPSICAPMDANGASFKEACAMKIRLYPPRIPGSKGVTASLSLLLTLFRTTAFPSFLLTEKPTRVARLRLLA